MTFGHETLTQPSILNSYFKLLLDCYGPQDWWPGEGPFEMMIGAILTQNTAWSNVEKAIGNLKREKLVNPKSLYHISRRRLARLIRPSGYFNLKADRIKAFVQFLHLEYQGSPEKMFSDDVDLLRQKLLRVKGIGPETADSILLYAGEFPVFVIDEYTRRMVSRHGLAAGDMDYHDLQTWFMDRLPHAPGMFNEFHALIVRVGKDYCRRHPLCSGCPLETLLN